MEASGVCLKHNATIDQSKKDIQNSYNIVSLHREIECERKGGREGERENIENDFV